MSTLSPLSRRAICPSCLHRLTYSSSWAPSLSPIYTSVRGKKKLAKKPTTINVRLLADIKGYGRKGSIVPVAPGLFRNTWLPRRRADYLSTLQDGVRAKDVVAERDFTFGMEQETKADGEGDESYLSSTEGGSQGPSPNAAARDLKRSLISPKRSYEILEQVLPENILFYRVPINEPVADTADALSAQSRAVSLAAEIMEAASASESTRRQPQAELQTIFGSVSTSDIADSIKALLATEEESSRVIIGVEDIDILNDEMVGKGIEGDRLKALGDFEVLIRVQGGEAVQRTISIRAQEDQPESSVASED